MIDLEPVAAAVLARLGDNDLPGGPLIVFDGEPGDFDFNGNPVDLLDGDKRAKPYVAFYDTSGLLTNPALCADLTDVDWQFQITCAGGDQPRARRAITRTRTRLFGWQPVVDGYELGEIRHPDGAGNDTLRTDRDLQPHRSYVPLVFALPVSAIHVHEEQP